MINAFLVEAMQMVLRASVLMTLMATCAWCVSRWYGRRSPRVVRIAWAITLCGGLAFGPLEIPCIPATITKTGLHVATTQPQTSLDQETGATGQQQVASPIALAPNLPSIESGASGAATTDVLSEDSAVNRSWGRGPLPPTLERPVVAKIPVVAMIHFSLQIIGVIWVIGVVARVLGGARRYGAVLQEVDGSAVAAASWQQQWDRVIHQTGVSDSLVCRLRRRKTIPMLVHDRLGPAIVWSPSGFRLVVPGKAWRAMPLRQRRAVLVHEAAHVHRGDVFWSLIAQLVVTLHWFNPVARVSGARFDAAAEVLCDQIAGGGTRKLDYVAALLSLGGPTRIAMVAAAGSPPLAWRIRRLLDLDGQHKPSKRGRGWLAIAMMFGLIVVANVRLVALAQESDAQDRTRPTSPGRLTGENDLADGPNDNGGHENAREVFGQRGFTLESEPEQVAFSPDGRFIASNHQSSLHPVHLHSAITGVELRRLKTDIVRAGWTQQLAFTPDSKSVIGVIDGIVHMWDVESGARLGKGKLGSKRIAESIAVSKAYFAIGVQGRGVAVFDRNKINKPVHLLRLANETKKAGGGDPFGGYGGAQIERQNVFFSDSGDELIWVTAGADPFISRWNPRTGAMIDLVPLLADSGQSLPETIFYAFPVDKDSVLIGTRRKSMHSQYSMSSTQSLLRLQQWNVFTGRLERELTSERAFAKFKDDRNRDGPFPGDRFRHWLETQPMAFGGWNQAAISNDRKRLLTSDRSQLHLWNLETGELISRRAIPEKTPSGSVAISPSGKQCFLESYNRVLRFELPTLAPIEHKTDGQTHPSVVSFSPELRRAVTGHTDCTLRMWDKSRTTPLWQRSLSRQYGFPFHRPQTVFAQILGDGKRVLAAAKVLDARIEFQGVVSLLDAETGETESEYRLFEAISGGALSPDESKLVLSTQGLHLEYVKVIDLETGVTMQLPGPEVAHSFHKVVDVEFTRDGNAIWVYEWSGTARQFDAQNGAMVKQVQWPLAIDQSKKSYFKGPAVNGHFTDDNRMIAFNSDVIHVWRLDDNEIELTIRPETRMVRTGISPDSRVLVGCTANSWVMREPGPRTIEFWSLETGKLIGKRAVADLLPVTFKFTPESDQVAGLHRDGTVVMYDVPE